MPKIHLIEGPVGAGKTTYARKLALQYQTPALVLDDWMQLLYSPDRPQTDIWTWYGERKVRCIEQIWKVAVGLLETGNDAILELGLVQRQSRLAFYGRMEAARWDYSIHVLDAPIEERRRRVMKRNVEKGSTFAMEVTADIFEVASKMWEDIDPAETEGRDIQLIC